MDLCKKCGYGGVSTIYNNAFDLLEKRCFHCGYKWTEEPIDKKRKVQKLSDTHE